MKKKTKKPKEELIDSLLEDLKGDDNGVSDHEASLLIGPNGIEASGKYTNHPSSSKALDDHNDKTTLLGQEVSQDDPTALYSAEFFVSDDNQKKPIEEAAKGIAASKHGLKENPLHPSEPNPNELVFEPQPVKETKPTAKADAKAQAIEEKPEPKVSAPASARAPSTFESQFARAENLKIAQQRILELEQYIEKYRKENEMLSSASEIAKNRVEELISKSLLLEKQKAELKELNESELRIFKDGLVLKDSEIHRLRAKVDELESRLANDLRRVRVRERELENRLELAKVEKTTLLRAKDEAILELKRKTENLQAEIETYQNRVLELNHKIEANQDQFARTVRALRLALTNLEVNNEGTSTSITLTPMKKAD